MIISGDFRKKTDPVQAGLNHRKTIQKIQTNQLIQEEKIMKLEITKAEMRKGVLEYCILLALENKPLYVSDIIENLKESEMIVVEGTLYPKLIRLKNEGFLGYRWEESVQGPPRKYYELTDNGKQFLTELRKVWHDLVETILHIGSKN
jgi:PadR family transcriptional regulator, regulatory protein PadR